MSALARNRYGISPGTLRYALAIRLSGQFDPDYYLGQVPGLAGFWRRFPELHYAIAGEPRGIPPNERFSPTAYLRLHTDVAGSTTRPFLHYLRHGQFEGRAVVRPSADRRFFSGDVVPVDPWKKSADIAVVAHVYYPDIWEEIAAHLSLIGVPFDLIVTIPAGGVAGADFPDRCRGRFPQARLIELPNLGRDIFPFVHVANSGALSQYAAICKVHTKKSPHLDDGPVWRQQLLNGLIPKTGAGDLVDAFIREPDAKLLVADKYCLIGDNWWGQNRDIAFGLLQRLNYSREMAPLRFPAGSMYWVKPDVLEAVRDLDLTPQCFETEEGQLDGTTAHAFERVMGYLAHSIGGGISETSELVDTDARHRSIFDQAHLPREFRNMHLGE